jgi:hypothetical protein
VIQLLFLGLRFFTLTIGIILIANFTRHRIFLGEDGMDFRIHLMDNQTLQDTINKIPALEYVPYIFDGVA